MRRIEIVPADNPVLECCDHSVACFIRIFEANTLPKRWAGLKRIFLILINFILLALCYASDWLFYIRLPKLRGLLENTTDAAATPSTSREALETFDIIRSIYFACLIISAVILVSMQCFVYLFALWRKTWRQTVVLVVEMLALVVQVCSAPILACLLFLLTGVGTADVCECQLLALGIAHSVYLVAVECAKLVSLGLCCCSCFSSCLFVWPVYRACRIVCCDCDTKDMEYQSTACRHRTFAATILDFMPPETDRGSWFAATKWCILTIWTFPMTMAGLLSCAILISIVALNRNFIYYKNF